MSSARRRLIDLSIQPLIFWRLDEATATYNNQGAGGAAQLTVGFGSGFTPHVAGPGTEFAGDFDTSGGGAGLGTLNPNGVVPSGSAFSFSLWVYRRTGGSGSPPLLSHSYGPTWPTSGNFGNAIILTSAHDGTWEPGFYLVGGGVIFFDVTAHKIPLNVWTHIAATFDGTTLIAYFNGTAVQSTVASGAPRVVDFNGGAGYWMAGGNVVLHGSDLFEGKLYGLRVDSRVLSPTEIAALAASP